MDEEVKARVLEALFEWRKDTSREEDIPIPRILGNEALEEIAETGPSTIDDLLKIKGIGPGKAEKWGDEILAVVHRNGGGGIPVTIGNITSSWKEDTHYPLGPELQSFVQDSDRFFSPTKQKSMAEKRKATDDASKGLVPERPSIITSGIDLLILKAKRQEALDQGDPDPEWGCPPFCVGQYSANLESRKYELVLAVAISFVEGCLYLEDAEGKPLSKFALAHRMKEIGAPLPEGYGYLSGPPCSSFWPDAEKYSHMWQLRHRVMEEQ